MPAHSFEGLRVLALESRRAQEIGKLIATWGGEPIIAPSVKEVTLDSNPAVQEFARKLAAGEVDIVIFTTGVGVKTLATMVESVLSREDLSACLNKVAVIARGPKPTAALRELGVRASLIVPEPNTWRDLLRVLDEKKDAFPLAGRAVAVQEYGVTNRELSAGLQERGALVFPLTVYQWALPEDTAPLRAAVQSVIAGSVHVLLVASSVQIRHLFLVAETMGLQDALRKALSRVVIASIGPLTSEELRNHDLSVDVECTHPKMGFLVQEAAEKSGEVLRRKRLANVSPEKDLA